MHAKIHQQSHSSQERKAKGAREAHGEGFVTETGRLLGVRAGVPCLNGGAIAAPDAAEIAVYLSLSAPAQTKHGISKP